MKINSLCKIISLYNAIFEFFIESGFGELQDLTPHPAFASFVDSYSQFGGLVSYWEDRGLPACNETLSF